MKKLILVIPAVVLIATAAHAQKVTTWTTAAPGTTTTTQEWSTQQTTVVPAKVVPVESAGAQTTTQTTTSYVSYNGELFRANEFSIDAFATFATTDKTPRDSFDQDLHRGIWGGGVGMNYFITRYIGFGGDMVVGADDGGQFVDSASGNLIFRFPFEQAHLAPYLFGGGGGQFQPQAQWLADAGVGLEFRLMPNAGIFMDGRYVWPKDTVNYVLARAGLRFAF